MTGRTERLATNGQWCKVVVVRMCGDLVNAPTKIVRCPPKYNSFEGRLRIAITVSWGLKPAQDDILPYSQAYWHSWIIFSLNCNKTCSVTR